ncbi:tumor necrosis factor receptor superfamily member 6B-like [Mugil cephalus]|uniref:tumor necrosis factor receptor superfamily member 6B-like n=1 Tax=Mugil cephalus TaxID=48193 RepID=UPI001FB72B8F|nr:tumor necrosis factor receptor superfamily member 6B-like [Mugil cephalus]
MMLLSLLSVFLLPLRSAQVAGAASPLLTFEDTDPLTGVTVQCDLCPPGRYLRASCSSTRKSDCAQCPPGSFTELWNYIPRCLRCSVCGHDQVVKSECTPSRDCQCQCKPGYYFKKDSDMCARHSECPSGHGVLTAGTPDHNTVCQVCSNGTFSNTSSAQHNCTEHKTCSGAGLILVLKGSSWHDSLCANSADPKDGAEYLREILPAFFLHHKLNVKRLRRIVNRLLPQDGRRHVAADLNTSELHARINSWAASATPSQIRQLLSILIKTGTNGAERLKNRLDRIEANLREHSSIGNEVGV